MTLIRSSVFQTLRNIYDELFFFWKIVHGFEKAS